MQFPKNLLFVSPHCDDILLTFFGLIEKHDGFADHNIQSLLIFSLAQWITNDPNNDDLSLERIHRVTIQRYLEETEAINSLFKNKARTENYGYADAPIRSYKAPATSAGGPWGNFSTFGKKEIEVYHDLIALFKNKLQIPESALFVLMANGSHIDHFIVREAVITAARNLGDKAKCKIYFGADQPYTGANPEQAVEQMLHLQQRLKLQKISYKINYQHKIDAFASHYPSQFSNEYKTSIENWAHFNNDHEDIYLWDPSDYAAAPADSTYNASPCKDSHLSM